MYEGERGVLELSVHSVNFAVGKLRTPLKKILNTFFSKNPRKGVEVIKLYSDRI